MSIRFTRVLFGAVLFAAAVAQAKVVYVVPNGAGAKDGTSWGDAYASVGDAYASAAEGATAEAPGEVWIKKGFYNVAAFGIITMKPHVHVYGGFDGDETLVDEADPEANWSILCENHYASDPGKYYWKDESGVTHGGVWTYANGVYTYNPIPEGVYWHGSDCGNNEMFRDAGGDGTDNEFHGIVFTGCSKGGAIELTAGGATARVCNCRFLANTGYTGNSHSSIYTTGNVSLSIENCRFEGCNTALNFGSTTADTVITVTNCQFVSCFAKSGTAGGVISSGEGLTKVLGCSFDRSWVDSNQFGVDVVAACQQTVIRDCTFRNSRCFSDYGTPCVVVGASNIKIDIERCAFLGSRSTIGRDAYSASACIKDQATIKGSDVVVRDSYFADNVLTVKGAQSNGNRSYGCICGQQAENYHTFVNCTVASNVVINESTGTQPHVSMISGGYNTYNDVFVNCVFKDNDSLRVSTAGEVTTTNRVAEFDFGGASGSVFKMQNTIATHSAEDYIPFVNAKPSFAATCIKGLVYTSGLPPLLNCDPMLTDGPETKDGVTAWGLKCGSPCRKGGYLVWEGTDRQFYFRDPTAAAETPWRSLTTRALVSDVEAADVGVSLAEDPLPDAFGENWRNGRVAMGPLNAPVSGLILLVR